MQFLCCETGYWLKYWATAALNLSLPSISLMCRGMEFQSMTVLGINEYFHDFRQFLLVAIWINDIDCVLMSGGPGAESFALVWQGDPIGLDVQWRPCSALTFLLSSNDSHSSSFFHFCDTAPTFIVACYETSTRVSKWWYQHLILTPNTWLSLTKEGVPTGPTTVFRRPLIFFYYRVKIFDRCYF